MSQLVINTSFNIELGFELAPIHKRIIAYLLDTFIIVVYLLTVLYAMSSSLSDLFNDDNGLGFVVSFLIACPILFYHLASEVLLNGESVGKTIIGLVLYCFIDSRAKKNKDNFSRWISSRMLVNDKVIDVDLYWDDHYELL